MITVGPPALAGLAPAMGARSLRNRPYLFNGLIMCLLLGLPAILESEKIKFLTWDTLDTWLPWIVESYCQLIFAIFYGLAIDSWVDFVSSATLLVSNPKSLYLLSLAYFFSRIFLSNILNPLK
jgi:hypothetical protein